MQNASNPAFAESGIETRRRCHLAFSPRGRSLIQLRDPRKAAPSCARVECGGSPPLLHGDRAAKWRHTGSTGSVPSRVRI